MFKTTPLKRLRELRWLEMLPDNIDVPAVFDRPDQVVPIEPLYLRRPDAEVPNPLKHVLGHAGADKA